MASVPRRSAVTRRSVIEVSPARCTHPGRQLARAAKGQVSLQALCSEERRVYRSMERLPPEGIDDGARSMLQNMYQHQYCITDRREERPVRVERRPPVAAPARALQDMGAPRHVHTFSCFGQEST